MHVIIQLVYNLRTGKRTHRNVVIVENMGGPPIDSPLTTQLLLPTHIPQQWLPAALRTGEFAPVSQYFDRSYVFQDGPGGLSGALPGHEHRPVIDETFRPSEDQR